MSGCGMNLDNQAPTYSINQMIKNYNEENHKNVEPFTKEQLLAYISAWFDRNYLLFMRQGFEALLQKYYQYWLHR